MLTHICTKSFKGTEHSLKSTTVAEPQMKCGHRDILLCLSQEGLLLPPHPCVSTATCAPSPTSLWISQWETQINSSSKAGKGIWAGCSATLLCWQRTGMGRDRDTPGHTAGPCHRLSDGALGSPFIWFSLAH